MRRFLKRLFCLPAMMLLGAVAPSQGSLKTSGDYDYVPLEDGTVMITKYRGVEKNLSIPSTLDGLHVTGIWDYAFASRYFRSVFIPEGITSIGDGAFSDCHYFESATIPDSVTFIGSNPFAGSAALREIHISLEQPVLATIDGVLFHKKEKRLICRPCKLPGTTYAVPKGIRAIDSRAFQYCKSLSSVSIPDSVTTMGDNPFADCEVLERIDVTLEQPILATIDGVLFHKKEKRLICRPPKLTGTTYSVPKGIRAIDSRAFQYCDSLTSVSIPDGVTVIGDRSFCDCTHLTSVSIPSSVTDIGASAFRGCKRLESVSIPENVTSISDGMCHYCTHLTSVSIPSSVTDIGMYSFEFCISLTSVTLPASVKSIGARAFNDCSPDLTFTVTRNSYAAQWVRDKGYKYTYPDLYDWLND